MVPLPALQYISEAVQDFLGVTPGEVMRDHELLQQRVLPEDVRQLRRSLLESMRQLKPLQQEYRVVMPDGELRWHHDQRRALAGPMAVPSRTASPWM